MRTKTLLETAKSPVDAVVASEVALRRGWDLEQVERHMPRKLKASAALSLARLPKRARAEAEERIAKLLA